MYNASFHDAITHEELPQAQRLATYIKNNFVIEQFYDFGCSSGIYLNELKKSLPAVSATGFEFAQDAITSAVCPDVQLTDLTMPLNLVKKPNTLGICLEVLEHIDDSSWRPVLENITGLCDLVIFTAAIPGQGGTGHINCRRRLDWIRRFHDLGWIVDIDATEHIVNYMRGGIHMGWFVQNVIVFVPASYRNIETYYKNYF